MRKLIAEHTADIKGKAKEILDFQNNILQNHDNILHSYRWSNRAALLQPQSTCLHWFELVTRNLPSVLLI